MVIRRPLVINDGLISDLREGDTVNVGVSTTTLLGVSGLAGGDLLSNNPRIDTQLLPNPSGVIFVGDAIGLDGVAQVTSEVAIASGNAAAVLASDALASGNNSLVVASAALASGNAALTELDGLVLASNDIRVEASAAVASGMPVGFDDSGKVAPVRTILSPGYKDPMVFGAPGVAFESNTIITVASVYDSFNKKVVIFYRLDDASDYGYAIVGTVANDSITFGTPVVFASTVTTVYDAAFDPDTNQIVVVYRDVTADSGVCIVGAVSGDTISFGTSVVFLNARVLVARVVYDTLEKKAVLIYEDNTTAEIRGRVGTVSSLSISLGAAAVLDNTLANTTALDAAYDAGNQVVAWFADNSTTDLRLGIATVTGTSISVDDTAVIYSGNGFAPSLVYAPNQQLVLGAYEAVGARAFTADLSGGTISVVADVLVSTSDILGTSLTYDSTASLPVLAYNDNTVSSGVARIVEPSGTTINVYSGAYIDDGTIYLSALCYAADANRVVLAQRRISDTFGVAYVASGIVNVEQTPLLAGKSNYVGISQSTVASGSTCLVNLPGKQYIDPDASLSKGSFYYLNPVATGITTDSALPPAWEGDVPYTYIGKATSSSGLLLLDCL